jgi:hypothetical protein
MIMLTMNQSLTLTQNDYPKAQVTPDDASLTAHLSADAPQSGQTPVCIRGGEGSVLPPQWTRFFGREAEIAQVQRLLQSEARLVVLTGTGGSGKTRLALEIAQRIASEENGQRASLWFVPLADVTDARVIASEIIGALRLPRIPQMPPLVQAIQSLGERAEPIFILDNLEHLLPEAAAIIQELLARVPQLRLIVTSRQELQIAGEHPFPVPPLPIPEAGLRPESQFEKWLECVVVAS